MANLNRVILAGNLTRDPQLSYTPNNTAVCKFGMAINRRWTDRQSGEKRDETCFVDVTAFGRSAETINQYMSKGRGILVEGRLQFSQWTNPEGQKRSKLEVVAENFQFLGGRGEDTGPRPEREAGREPARSFDEDAPSDVAPTTDDDGIPF
jgi:single-strand DNA-binding protein